MKKSMEVRERERERELKYYENYYRIMNELVKTELHSRVFIESTEVVSLTK